MPSTVRASAAHLSALVHATEDYPKVAQAMANLVAELVPRTQSSRTRGHYGNEIRVVRAELKGSTRAEKFLLELWARLSDRDRRQILTNLASHLDQSGRLFLRVDKQEAFEGRVQLADAEPVRIEIVFDMRGVRREGLAQRVTERLEGLSVPS